MTSFDPTTQPPPPPPPPEASTADAPAEQPAKLAVGDLVTFTYQDAGENDIVRYGTVVELVDNANGHDPTTSPHDSQPVAGARVAWLADVSDPIPLDQLERDGDSR